MIEQSTFYIFSLLALVSLWGILKSRSLVRAIAFFAVFLITIAIFFGLLKAPFLAMGQLVIFTGGMIAILLIGISFSGMEEEKIPNQKSKIQNKSQAQNPKHEYVNGLYIAIALFFLVTLAGSLRLFFRRETFELPAKELALQLFGSYWPIIPFFLLMFLAALLSAVYFLKRED